MQIEAENELFKNQKFFTPLKSFLPPFFHMLKNFFWIFEKVAIFAHGKKEGVKNFWGG